MEHLANVATHGVWILPALLAGLELVRRAPSRSRLLSALVYGAALLLLFVVSTVFHCVHCCCSSAAGPTPRLGGLKDLLHRCDRAMIYVFIAASYFPWLESSARAATAPWRLLVWAMAGLGILYQQLFHERYKRLETCFYVLMGLGPSVAVVGAGEFDDIPELQLGGLLYLLGIVFFKLDGRLACAHAIWHLFVAGGAGLHYLAILRNLYPLHPGADDSSSAAAAAAQYPFLFDALFDFSSSPSKPEEL